MSQQETVTIYISGPMTGMPELNYPAFESAKKLLQSLGYKVLSPHEAPTLESWEAYMRYDIPLLCQCDEVATLKGWEKSKGARLEVMIAEGLSMPVHDISHYQESAL